METIEFENARYPIKNIFLPNYGEVTLSTSLLNIKIMNDNGSYSSEEARLIDESILFYVEQNEIHYSENKLIKLINQTI
jgi:hypothetical protein